MTGGRLKVGGCVILRWRGSVTLTTGKHFPAAVRGWGVTVEFGRTQFLPLFAKQVFKTRFLSVWKDVKR